LRGRWYTEEKGEDMKPENLKKLKQIHIFYSITVMAVLILGFYAAFKLQQNSFVSMISSFGIIFLIIGVKISNIIKAEQD